MISGKYSVLVAFHKVAKNILVSWTAEFLSFPLIDAISPGRHYAADFLILSLD